jgi:orotidine-5'-phosphate decarboxylase
MAKDIPLNERIIIALDVDSADQAARWLDRLGDHVRFYKVGLQLFLAGGFPVIDRIRERGHKVMLDLKFFDIPETVALAVREVRERGATFITVHGNDPIIRAAVQERGAAKILAVTVLTSFDESDLRAMGLTGTVKDLVYLRAKKALDLGCDGVVSSGLEAEQLRAGLGEKFLIVTPGIRPGTNDVIQEDDQKRIASAYSAIRSGADYVVVGRPIRDAADPVAVVRAMQNEIKTALSASHNGAS